MECYGFFFLIMVSIVTFLTTEFLNYLILFYARLFYDFVAEQAFYRTFYFKALYARVTHEIDPYFPGSPASFRPEVLLRNVFDPIEAF